jgi:hypothetical protein
VARKNEVVHLDSRRSFLDSKSPNKRDLEMQTRNSKLKMNQTQEFLVQPTGVSFSSTKRRSKDSVDLNSVKSHLSKEVESIPLYHLKRLFKGNLSEYSMFKIQKKVGDFNSDTIFRADVNESYKRLLEAEHQSRLEEKAREQ